MRYHLRLLLLGWLSVTLFSVSAYAAPSIQTTTSGMPMPLPADCATGLPASATVPAACLFGYVYIDGQAVADALVTITLGNRNLEVATRPGPDSTEPYFRVNLSDGPLAASIGSSLRIRAEYSSHRSTVDHVVLAGAQQVDVVLPRVGADDYVFERQVWRQGEPGLFSSPTDVAIDRAGAIYVADGNNSRVQVFNRQGQLLRQWGTLGNGPGEFADPRGIVIDVRGDVYVVDSLNDRIQKFTSTGTWLGTIGRAGSGNGQFRRPVALSFGPNGDLYVADSLNNRVQQIRRNGTFVTQWTNCGTTNFDNPNGVAVDGNGNVYVANTDKHQVHRVTPAKACNLTLGSAAGAGDGQFNRPSRVVLDEAGNIIVADTENHRFVQFDSRGDLLQVWGGPNPGNGNGEFRLPRGIHFAENGSVTVADAGNHRIQLFDAGRTFRSTFGRFSRVDGQFVSPRGITGDNSGTIYITDAGTHTVQRLTSDGQWQATLGSFGDDNGQFNRPTGVVVDANGDLFVTDAANARVQKLRNDGTWLATIGNGFGTADGQFGSPRGIALDTNGELLVTDEFGGGQQPDRVQRFDSAGSWSGTFSGTDTLTLTQALGVGVAPDRTIYVTDFGDVNNNRSRVLVFDSAGNYQRSIGERGLDPGEFIGPKGIFIDQNGFLFVVDTNNSRIQKLRGDGSVAALFGALGGGDGEFGRPYGVWVANDGRVYVTDDGNSRVQIVRPMTFTAPIATIVAASPRTVQVGQNVQLVGRGTDSDETPGGVTYAWTLDGSTTPFATTPTATLATSDLSVGSHRVTLTVRDDEGEVSAPQTVVIDVVPATATAQTWTLLLYLAGDNANIAEALNPGSPSSPASKLLTSIPNGNVQVAILYDGNNAGADSTRYLLRSNGQVSQESLGEINTGDPQTLADFVQWAKQQAPASHYYLSIASLSNGIDGLAWDSSVSSTERLTNAELRQAMVSITANGAQPLDVVHFDGSLMGLAENSYQMRGMTDYLIASQNLSWNAFAYDQYRQLIGPTTQPGAFAAAVAQQYSQLTQGRPSTVAVIDLGQVDTLSVQFDTFATALTGYALASSENRARLAELREQVQKLDSSGDVQLTSSDAYVDLGHLADLARTQLGDTNVQNAAIALQNALDAAVVYQQQVSGAVAVGNNQVQVNLGNTTGLGVYFPAQADISTYRDYGRITLNLPIDTGWDEFLAAALAERPFDPNAPAPNPVAPLTLPGTSQPPTVTPTLPTVTPIAPSIQPRVFLPGVQR